MDGVGWVNVSDLRSTWRIAALLMEIIENFRLKIEYLRSASLRALGSALYEPEASGSILKRNTVKMQLIPKIGRYCKN
jgi:hypothetical protein